MKNSIKCILVNALALLMFLLCACGNETPAETAAPTQQPAETADVVPTPDVEPTETQPADSEDSDKATAESLIDQDVQELYDAIGYPESADYASSCLGPGEDGELHYDGFTVYTYRENGKETIRVVL